MKRALFLLTVLSSFTLVACQSTPQTETEKQKPDVIDVTDIDEYGGADGYASMGDNANSQFYVNADFYRLTSNDQLTIIPNFKTMQQTSEWSCGPASALMTLTHFGKTDLTEMEIAIAMTSSVDDDVEGALPGSANNFPEYGTNVMEMYDFFSNLDGFTVVESSYSPDFTDADIMTEDHPNATPSTIGNYAPTFSSNALYTSENSDASELWVEDAKDSYFVNWLTGHLNAQRPIMVEWAAWDGHWVTIIGYDNNGTPGIGDDMLIFADSYDSGDHWQDGYTTFPLEQFFYMWKDRNIAPKPLQMQPFIVIDKVS